MTRITTRQPATARPVPIAVAGLSTSWETLIEAPDFSVPDTQNTWAERDPLDAARRIQPGQVLIEAPILAYNADTEERWVEFRMVLEDGTEVPQGRFNIPGGETYAHLSSGQILVKIDPTSENGGRLQARAEVAGVISLTSTASVGSAEQDQPVGV